MELLIRENHRFYGPETVFISKSHRDARIDVRENNRLIKNIENLIKMNVAIFKYITLLRDGRDHKTIGNAVEEDRLFTWNEQIPSYSIKTKKSFYEKMFNDDNSLYSLYDQADLVFLFHNIDSFGNSETSVKAIIANRITIMCNSMITQYNSHLEEDEPDITQEEIMETGIFEDLNTILSRKRKEINTLIQNSSLNQVKQIICGSELQQREPPSVFLNNADFELRDGTIITKTAAIKIICKLLKTFDANYLRNNATDDRLLILIQICMIQFMPILCDDFVRHPDTDIRDQNCVVYDNRNRLKGIIVCCGTMVEFLQNHYNIQMTIDYETAVKDASKKNFATSQATRRQCILFAKKETPSSQIDIVFPDVICLHELIKKLMDSQHDTGRAIGEYKGNVILAQNNSFLFLFMLLNNVLKSDLIELGLNLDPDFNMVPIDQPAFFGSSAEVSEPLKQSFNDNYIIVVHAEDTIFSSAEYDNAVGLQMLHLLSIWKFNYYLFTFILLTGEPTKKPPSFEPMIWSFFNTSLTVLLKKGFIQTHHDPDSVMKTWCGTNFTQNAVLHLGEICENFNVNQKAIAATLIDSGAHSKRFDYEKHSMPCNSQIITRCSNLQITDSTQISPEIPGIPGDYPTIQNIYEIKIYEIKFGKRIDEQDLEFTANWTENITLAGTTAVDDTYNVNGFHTLSGIAGTDDYSFNHKHNTGNQASYDVNNQSDIFKNAIQQINVNPNMESVITAIIYFMKKAQRDDNFFKNGFGVLDTVFTADLANFVWMTTDRLAMHFCGVPVRLNKFGLVCPSNRACVEITAENFIIATNAHSDGYIEEGKTKLTEQEIHKSWNGGGKFAIGDMVFNQEKLAIISIINSDATYNIKYPNGDIKKNISEKDVTKPEKIKICEMLLQIVTNSNIKDKEQIQIFLKDSKMCDIIIFCIMFIIKNLSKCEFVVPPYNLDLVDPPEENVTNEKATEDKAIKIIEKIFDNGDCSKYLSTFVSKTKFNWLIVRFIEKIYIDYLNDFFILESVKTLKTILLDEPNFEKFEKSFTEIINLFELSEFTGNMDTKGCLKKIIKLSIKALVAGKMNVDVADNNNNFIAIDKTTDLLCKDSYSFTKIKNMPKVAPKVAPKVEEKTKNSLPPLPPGNKEAINQEAINPNSLPPSNLKTAKQSFLPPLPPASNNSETTTPPPPYDKDAIDQEMRRQLKNFFDKNPLPPGNKKKEAEANAKANANANERNSLSMNTGFYPDSEEYKFFLKEMNAYNTNFMPVPVPLAKGGKRKTRRKKPKKTRKRFQKRSKKFQKKSRKA